MTRREREEVEEKEEGKKGEGCGLAVLSSISQFHL